MIHIVLPTHLQVLARLDGEVQLDVQGLVTQRTVLNALDGTDVPHCVRKNCCPPIRMLPLRTEVEELAATR